MSRNCIIQGMFIESSYPLGFRQDDAKNLGQYLKNRHSVMLIGMRRVGISNFLRFFLYHKGITKTYINDGKKHLFIPVDLNDLVERELFPFWILTLKRITDAVEKSDVDEKVKKQINLLFLDGMQSQDLFLTIDSVRRALMQLVERNILPTLFFLRFDRITDAATPAFFNNLEGLKDATHDKLMYVFTSLRDLHTLSPNAFTKTAMPILSHTIYVKPAERKDIETIFTSYNDRYNLKLTTKEKGSLYSIVDGYVQYLQLSLIALHEGKIATKNMLKSLLADERISLQSEELWDSLTDYEQSVLLKIVQKAPLAPEEKEKADYLFDTGFVSENMHIFSPLFAHYVTGREKLIAKNHIVEFTKKESSLFTFLKGNINEVCERESIIEAVWPEVEALGVSDWAIDRLVARVRSKLKAQKGNYEVQTVKTRGYKLVNTR